MTMTIPFDANRLRYYCLANTKHILGDKDYVYIDNDALILAVAHCDTVKHKPTFSKATLDGNKTYFSPAMDDRLGVYTLLDVLPKMGLKYDILLTNDEEKGLSTASLFYTHKNYHWMFEFDRRGTGVVYYQYDQTELPKAAAKYLKETVGSFSDISYLDFLGCAGMNVGTGYYLEHTYTCHMIVEDWKDQVARFVNFYNAFKDTHFSYNYSAARSRNRRGGSYGYTLPASTSTSTQPAMYGSEYEYGVSSERGEQTWDEYLAEKYGDLANKEFEDYTLNRERYALPEGEVKFCDYCTSNADFVINGQYVCMGCDNDNWWDEYTVNYEKRYWKDGKHNKPSTD